MQGLPTVLLLSCDPFAVPINSITLTCTIRSGKVSQSQWPQCCKLKEACIYMLVIHHCIEPYGLYRLGMRPARLLLYIPLYLYPATVNLLTASITALAQSLLAPQHKQPLTSNPAEATTAPEVWQCQCSQIKASFLLAGLPLAISRTLNTICTEAQQLKMSDVQSAAMQAKKLLPFDQKLMDAIPGKGKKAFNARNEGDVQGPYQKSSGKIPGELQPANEL